MRTFIVALILTLCVATVVLAGSPAQLIGSVEAVYHEGVMSFQVDHADAIYVVTAWNAEGEVVVSQAAVTKNFTPIADISFDTIPGNTKFLGPNEIIMESDVQVGSSPMLRLRQSLSNGGSINFYEEDGTTRYAFMEPDASGQGGFLHVYGPTSSTYVQAEANGIGGEAVFSVMGTSDFRVTTANTGNESVVMPGNAVYDGEILDEPGVAAALSGSSVAVSSTGAAVLVRTLTAPTAGYVLAVATVDMQINHTVGVSNFSSCGISLSSTSIPSDGDQSVQVALGAAAGVYNHAISMNRIFSVAAGSDTYYVTCVKPSAASVSAWDRHLDLVFIPTAYGAVSTESIGGDGDMEFVDSYISPNGPMTQAELAELQAQADAMAGNDNNQP